MDSRFFYFVPYFLRKIRDFVFRHVPKFLFNRRSGTAEDSFSESVAGRKPLIFKRKPMKCGPF